MNSFEKRQFFKIIFAELEELKEPFEEIIEGKSMGAGITVLRRWTLPIAFPLHYGCVLGVKREIAYM